MGRDNIRHTFDSYPGYKILNRVLPQSPKTEKKILGIYLTHPEKRSLEDNIFSEMFYRRPNRKIFETMAEMEPLNGILLVEELRRQEVFEFVGGRDYIERLHKIGLDTNPECLQDCIQIVRETYLRRNLINCLFKGLEEVYEPSANVKEIIKLLSKRVSEILAEYNNL